MMKTKNSFKSIWSYSIYGEDYDKYYFPMIENIRLSKEANALIVISTNSFYEASVRSFFSPFLSDIKLIVFEGGLSETFPKLLRFMAVELIDADFYFFKDSDSIVTKKELEIMQNWIDNADADALIIRNHPMHIAPIMAGMFAIKRDLSSFLTDSIKNCFKRNKPIFYSKYGYDQSWLAKHIYPKIIKRALVLTSHFFYSNENLIRIEGDIEKNQFIGAQAYLYGINNERQNAFTSLYHGELLCLPFCKKISWLYSMVKPTLYLAYFLKFKKIPRLKYLK